MKQILALLFAIGSLATYAQKVAWIPFSWEGVTIAGRYIDKAAIRIPASVDGISHNFVMQLDLGAITSMLYGNTVESLPDLSADLVPKTDTVSGFYIKGVKHPIYKGVCLKLGSVSMEKMAIGCHKGYGGAVHKDSINSTALRYIGTIAPDLFADKVLIIDYPNRRIAVASSLPKSFSKAEFQPLKIKDGRIKISFSINGKQEYLLFDTGASMFSMVTTRVNADAITDSTVVDAFDVPSWGESIPFVGRKANVPLKLGSKQLNSVVVYYDKPNSFEGLYKQEQVWGITGNALFLDHVVIIDYAKKQFGVL